MLLMVLGLTHGEYWGSRGLNGERAFWAQLLLGLSLKIWRERTLELGWRAEDEPG